MTSSANGQEPSVLGYSVRGRAGDLGVVVASGMTGLRSTSPPSELLVVGGRSSLLRFHIPMDHVASTSAEESALEVDVDIADFRGELNCDGTVELRVIV